MLTTCDVAIIGAGTAGLSAERSARRAGAGTRLIDAAFNGTTCANVGCMPSKLLIAAANAAEGMRRAAQLGIHAQPRVDGRAVMARLRQERDAFAAATREEIAKLPDGVAVRATAHFVGPDTLSLGDGREIRARAIVIATGARPSIPPAFAGVRPSVLTNENLFELPDLPKSVAVVGAGPLGLELAQALSRLSVEVVVFGQDHKLGGVDQEPFAAVMKSVLARELELHPGVEVSARRVERGVSLRWHGDSSGERVFDHVLVAAGRPPDLEALKLSAAGVELDARGVPLFDRTTMQCGDSAIFLAGDADADRPVLHEASAEGAIAGHNAAHFPKVRAQHRCVPFSIMFTDPPLALVGQRSGSFLVHGESDYRRQGRARVEARAAGLAHILADSESGRLMGATLFCPAADHLAHLLSWAMEEQLDASALLDRPFYHPTFEEGLKPALQQICAKVGLSPPWARDEGVASGA